MSILRGTGNNLEEEPQEDPRRARRAQSRQAAEKLIQEALAGTASASGTASPEQQAQVGGDQHGFANQRISPSLLEIPELRPTNLPQGHQHQSLNMDLFGTAQQRNTPNTNGNVEDIDRFMHAISAQESGGNPNARNNSSGAYGQYQIMPANWKPWAKEAGLPANAPQNQTNQNKVARYKMQQYFNQFGSWDAVAVAWFAGPGRAKRFLEGDTSVLKYSDGNMTVGEYINKMNRGMGSG